MQNIINKYKTKNKAKMATISSLIFFVLLSGCATNNAKEAFSAQQNEAEMNKKINNEIRQAAENIEKQLQLLNETVDGIAKGKDVSAQYKLTSHLNIKEITNDDVNLMISKGISKVKTDKQDKPVLINLAPPVSKPNYYAQQNVIKTDIKKGNKKTGIKEETKQIENNQNFIDFFANKNTNKVEQKETVKTQIVKKTVKTNKAQQEQIEKYKELLNQTVTLQGNYKATDLIKILAKHTQFDVKIIGNDKNLIIYIGNDKDDSKVSLTIKDALIAIGKGLGSSVMINVNMDEGIITVEYK